MLRGILLPAPLPSVTSPTPSGNQVSLSFDAATSSLKAQASMGPLCDQWGRWGPPAAVVGVGKAWTHSPTVWGWFMSAQTLWPVGGSQEWLPGGHFGQTGWPGETGVCRAASGAPVKGAQQTWRQVSTIVGVGWLAVRLVSPLSSQGWRGGGGCHGHTTQGDPLSCGAWGLGLSG